MRTIFLSLLLLFPLSAQFGKNIVQYKNFDWHFIQTEYFDIYYYDNDINAQYVAQESHKAYSNISNALNWNLKIEFLLLFIIHIMIFSKQMLLICICQKGLVV